MRIALSVITAGCLAALASSAASADSGVRPIWTDFQPAVATQYRPPDGGRAYPKPDTNRLISAADRRANQRAQAEMDRRAAAPLPGRRDRPVLPPPSSEPAVPTTLPPPSPVR